MNGMISQCLVSFGSNLGQRESLIADAARRLARFPGLGPLRTSRLFQTPPIGGPGGQEPFLNAVAAFDTTLTAGQVLQALQRTEEELGRRRLARWGARSIDLDVVLHGSLMGGHASLTVPHPRYTARLFVLRPACDVAADFRDPRFGWTLRRLAEHLQAAPPSLALVGDRCETRQEICDRVAQRHGLRVRQSGASLSAIPAESIGCRGFSGPGVGWPEPVEDDLRVAGAASAPRTSARTEPMAESAAAEPWVAPSPPPLPAADSPQTRLPEVPRLLARLQRKSGVTRWPAPHQMWPSGWRWPEYRLEIDSLDWAVDEVASAIESMRCPADPVTASGDWWV